LLQNLRIELSSGCLYSPWTCLFSV